MRRPLAFLSSVRPRLQGGDALRFFPDRDDQTGQWYSAIHRFGARLPECQQSRIDDFVRFARRFIRVSIRRATADQPVSFKHWAETSSKPQTFIARLAKLRAERATLKPRDLINKSFIKFESYDKPKFPRSINSYEDVTKAVLGPIFRVVDECLFELKYFVKHINPVERASYLEEVLGGRSVVGTDFTSFESHHRREFAKLGCFWISHILRGLPDYEWARDLVCAMILGENTCRFSHVEAKILETLMSGAVWTSSLNGALNMLLMTYLVQRTKHPNLSSRELVRTVQSEFRGVFEGDDGLCAGSVDPALVAEMGLKLKFKQFPDYTTASFCGIVKSSRSSTDILTDPVKVICDFPVLEAPYRAFKETKQLGLLRAKAMSLYCLYRNTPIIGPYARAWLRRTRSIQVDTQALTYHQKEVLDFNKKVKFWQKDPEITMESRLAMEEIFGLDLAFQALFEEQIALFGEGREHALPEHDRFLVYQRNANFAIGIVPPETRFPTLAGVPREQSLEIPQAARKGWYCPADKRTYKSPETCAKLGLGYKNALKQHKYQCAGRPSYPIPLFHDEFLDWVSRDTRKGAQAPGPPVP